jgi:aldose 1-epimerase
MAAWAPSGEQWVLRHGRQEVSVVEVGGGIRDYTIGGQPVIDGYPVDAMCSAGRGATLVPWPNRLRDGHYTFDGKAHQLPLSEPAKNNAIHGLVRWLSWLLVDQTETSVTIEVTLLPQTGYPYGLRVRNAYTLDESGLTLATTATNIGPDRLPYGVGFHPYLTVGTPAVDQARLTIPADTWIAVDERGLPTDSSTVDGSPYDYRSERLIGEAVLDTAFAGLIRDEQGNAVVTLSGDARTIRVWADATFSYLQVFSGDTLDEDERRRGLAVEPMTCPPDAFNSGDGLISLEPGASHTTRWGISTSGYDS